MTHDDYTGETLKRCIECGTRQWHAKNARACSDCLRNDLDIPRHCKDPDLCMENGRCSLKCWKATGE